MISFLFPLAQTSSLAPKVDLLYDTLVLLSVGLMTPVVLAMIYFAVKYKAAKGDKSDGPKLKDNHLFEKAVSVFVGVLFFGIFVWGFVGYNEFLTPPVGAYEIGVTGQQWFWTFQYQNGKITKDTMYVPRGVPVKLIMQSKDVIHSFYIPAFRVKWDVVPGVYTSMWFQAEKAGENEVFCAEFCGADHSNMLAKVVVLEPTEFKAWLDGIDPGTAAPALMGEKSFKSRNCITCHTIDGKDSKFGPSLKGLAGKVVTLADGSTIVADDNYLRTSITSPGTHVVKNYAPIMPMYQGVLKSDEITNLIAYIKSLKE